MIRADYHVHTASSYDSRMSAAATLERALEAHLDLLCVTDHDTIDGAVRLQGIRCPEVQVVVGCEFTCDDGSHVIGLFLRDMIAERRVLPLLEQIKLQGGRVLLPHLFRRGTGIFRTELRRSPDFVRQALSRTDMVECFNGRDIHEHNERSRLFALEHGLASVAGSDAHSASTLGSVFVEYDASDCLHGVSPRRIFFRAQAPAREHPMKRRALELYHRHERHLPAAVRQAYRTVRARLRSDTPPCLEPLPRMQYGFPAAPSEHDG